METATKYTDTMPDGAPITRAHLTPGMWVQVWVGPWPYDTATGHVAEVHARGVTVAVESGAGWLLDGQPAFVPWRRIASALHPTTPA